MDKFEKEVAEIKRLIKEYEIINSDYIEQLESIYIKPKTKTIDTSTKYTKLADLSYNLKAISNDLIFENCDINIPIPERLNILDKIISNHNTVSPEAAQEIKKAIIDIQLSEQEAYCNIVKKSIFFKTLQNIDTITDTDIPDYSKKILILYFFAVNPDINYKSSTPLTTGQTKDLQKIFENANQYIELCAQCESINKDMITEFMIKESVKPITKPFTSIGGRLLVITEKTLQTALTTQTNANGIYRRTASGNKELAVNIDMPFVYALAKNALINSLNNGKSEIAIDLNAIARELNVSLRGENKNESREIGRSNFVNRLISELDDIWGTLGDTEYKLFSLRSWTPETSTLVYSSPYLEMLIDIGMKHKEEKTREDKVFYWYSDLLHSSAANERDKAAVEMATRLLQGISQRGTKPDNEIKGKAHKNIIKYTITCKTLIEECPQIREKLNNTPSTSTKTQILKRTFERMYRILSEKTDVNAYYLDFNITKVIPTTKTIDTQIVITHKGLKSDYIRPLLPSIENE